MKKFHLILFFSFLFASKLTFAVLVNIDEDKDKSTERMIPDQIIKLHPKFSVKKEDKEYGISAEEAIQKITIKGYDVGVTPLIEGRSYLRIAYDGNIPIDILFESGTKEKEKNFALLTINQSNVLAFNSEKADKTQTAFDIYRCLLENNKFPFYKFDYYELLNTVDGKRVKNSLAFDAKGNLNDKLSKLEQSYKDVKDTSAFEKLPEKAELQNNYFRYIINRDELISAFANFYDAKKYCEENYKGYIDEGTIGTLNIINSIKNFLNANKDKLFSGKQEGIENIADEIKFFLHETRCLLNKQKEKSSKMIKDIASFLNGSKQYLHEDGLIMIKEMKNFLKKKQQLLETQKGKTAEATDRLKETLYEKIELLQKNEEENEDAVKFIAEIKNNLDKEDKHKENINAEATYVEGAIKWMLDKKEQLMAKQAIINALLQKCTTIQKKEEIINTLQEALNQEIENLCAKNINIEQIKEEMENFLSKKSRFLRANKKKSLKDIIIMIKEELNRRKYPLIEEKITNIISDIENFLQRKEHYLSLQKRSGRRFLKRTDSFLNDSACLTVQNVAEQVEDFLEKEQQFVKTEAQKTIDEIEKFLEKEQIVLSQIGQLFMQESESLDGKERQYDPKANIKLFLERWGREAEDALVFYILKNVEKYKRIPHKIEIYGTLDPCFQCQIKLQWLADLLAGKLEGAKIYENMREVFKGPVEICYYSKEKAETGCVLFNLPSHVIKSDRYMTRAIDDKGKIKKFIFDSSRSDIKQEEPEIEIFNIFDIDLENPYHLTLEDIEIIIVNASSPIKIHLKNYAFSNQDKQEECKTYMKKIYSATQTKIRLAKNEDEKNKISIEVAVSKKGKDNTKYGINCKGSKEFQLTNLCSP